ncbi:MAG: RHS repeat-associated core domain-containing protein [Deltaproteobacteria bacterium]|nr:RHS repeat-associated core domain-containing protein [Deltaproteobacteria bacterium]
MEGQTPESNGQGLADGKGKGKGAGGATGALPGQGVEHRSEQGAAHAQNTLKNPHYTGEFPGRGLEHRSATAGQHAQNTVKNKNLQGEAQDVVVQLGKNGEHLYFHHSDHLGSVSTVTNADGKPVEHLEYFPFGETWLDQHHNVDKTSYRFTGKEYDQETGLYYFGARYYEPRLSIWTSTDPILGSYMGGKPNGGVYSLGNLSLYSYGRLNPILYIDPNGKWWSLREGGKGYEWSDKKCEKCRASAAAVEGNRVHLYLSNREIRSVNANKDGMVSLADMKSSARGAFAGRPEARRGGGARFDLKDRSKAYLYPERAAASFNLQGDYYVAHPNDANLVITDAGIASGAHFGPHKSHNHGRAFDFRYMGSDGKPIQNDWAAGYADANRVGLLF